MNWKKLILKIVTVIILMKLKLKNNNILIDEKSNENILVSKIWYKTLIDTKHLLSGSIK